MHKQNLNNLTQYLFTPNNQLLSFDCINNYQRVQMQQKSITYNFRKIINDRRNERKAMSVDQQHFQQNSSAQQLKKRLQKLKQLQIIERQIKNRIKTLQDIEHSKRFTRLISHKRVKTQGSESKLKKDKNHKDQQSTKRHDSMKRSSSNQKTIQHEVNVKKIDFYDMNEEVSELDKRLNNLIRQKLSRLSSVLKLKQNKTEIPLEKDSNFYNDLNDLIKNIKKLKSKESDNQIGLLNKKIEYIESLMAQNTTESDLIKKYYYYCHSNQSRNKIGKFKSLGPRIFKNTKINEVYKDIQGLRSEQSPKNKPFFGESASQQCHKPPQKSFYKLQRINNNPFIFNNQPIPRSSYQRDFLKIRGVPIDSIKPAQQQSNVVPNYTTTYKSRYTLDYPPQKLQNVDYKDLDAYHNKFKFLPLSFLPQNQDQTPISNKESIQKEQTITHHKRQMLKMQKINNQLSLSKQEAIFDKIRFASQTRKQFILQNVNEKSRIKHKQLKQFEYRLKNLYKS